MEPILYETVDYSKIENRKRRRRFWLITLLLFVSIVLAAYAIWLVPLLFRDGNSPLNSWQDKNIPLYSNEIFQTRTNYTLHDDKTQKPTFYFEKRVYLSSDREQQIKAFFSQQLPASGWNYAQAGKAGDLNPINGMTGVSVILKRGKTEQLTLELGVVGQRTLISFTYQQILS